MQDNGGAVTFVESLGNAYTDIIVDSHEPANAKDFFKISLPLFAGDYLWLSKARNELVLVERKQLSTGEVLRSLFMPYRKGSLEAQLTTQARKMNTLNASRYLMIELGDFSVDAWTGRIILPNAPVKGNPIWPFKWTAFQKGVSSLCHVWDLWPWYAQDGNSTAENIIAIFEHSNRKKRTSQRHVNYIPQDVPIYGENISDNVQALCCTDGIGAKAAQAALTRFGSIAELCQVSIEDLKTIDGFGDKRAENLHQLLHRKGG